MDPAKKQRIGPYDLEVTQMGLGGTTFGNIYNAVADADANATLDAAYEAGIRYFDTAPLYGYGLSETRMGAGLQRYDRASFALSTKVGYTLVPRSEADQGNPLFAEAPPLTSVFDYSRDAVLRSFDSSLQRLGTDRVDILLIHDPDESASLDPAADPYAKSHFKQVMDEAYPALAELRSQKVVKAIGLGMNQWQMLHDFAIAGDFDCFLLAGRYTLLEQESLHHLLPVCTEKNIRIVVGGPYNSGILATGAVDGAYYNYAPADPATLDRVRRIESIGARHNVPLQAAALQFPFGHPTIATVIPGARSTAEIASNLSYFQHPIPQDYWSELKAENLIDPTSPTPTNN